MANNWPQQQVTDDPDLLKTMVEDLQAAPDVFRPGNYWKNYEDVFIPELLEMGLHDFRRRRDSVLTSFGATDESPSIVGFGSRPRGNRRRKVTLKGSLLAALLGITPITRRLRDTSAFTGLSLDGARRLMFEYARWYGAANRAVPLGQIEASVLGNPFDLFSHDGRPYTTYFLEQYLNYAYCSRFLDFDSTATIMELGSGAGKQAEVLRKAHSRLCFYLFDIPPQLYVCERYLASVFPGAVVSYRETRAAKHLPPAEEGRIFVFGTWKLAEMANLGWDLFWNAASFQEMEPNLVLNYLAFVNKSTRKAVYLHEAMQGMTQACMPGDHGVLSPTKFEHYKQGLPDFELADLSEHVVLPRVISKYSRTFWRRRT